jgi:hypothetical protein
LSTRKGSKYKSSIGFLIAGTIIIAVGLYAVSGGSGATAWEIMGRTVPPSEWGLPFAIVGIILLLIGAILAYFYFKKK